MCKKPAKRKYFLEFPSLTAPLQIKTKLLSVAKVFLTPVRSSSSDPRTFGVAGAGSRGRGRRRGRHGGAEAVGGDPERRHVLLRLEQDDVDLGSEEAAEHHRAAQTHRDAHGGGLHLWGDTSSEHSVSLMSL